MKPPKNSKPTIASAVINDLASAGVEHIFGFPGETSLPLYSALQKTSAIHHILARSPRGAAYMAEAYARVSGKIGICDAPGGIGSPFAVPALHEAKNSSTPMLFLTTGEPTSKSGWSTGSCEQEALFGSVSKFVSPKNVEEVPSQLSRALQLAGSPRTGPVTFEISTSLLQQPFIEVSQNTTLRCSYPLERTPPQADEVLAALNIFKSAKNPAILAGGGVHLSKAQDALEALISRTKIPCATTLNGKGVIPESDPNCVGVIGAKGHLSANAFLQTVDCLLVLGSKLGDKTTNYGSIIGNAQTIIQVDCDSAELRERGENYLAIRCDILLFIKEFDSRFQQLEARQPFNAFEPFWDEGLTSKLCELISDNLSTDDVLVADASVSSGWAGAAVQLRAKGQRLIAPRGSGSISYALPAAIGAQFARPNARVYAIGGDGGFSMAMHDMETAVRYKLPLIFFLLNNGRLGLIDRHAVDLLDALPVSGDFCNIEWNLVAEAFGWSYFCFSDKTTLASKFGEITTVSGPVLVDLKISTDEMAPDYNLTLRRKGG